MESLLSFQKKAIHFTETVYKFVISRCFLDFPDLPHNVIKLMVSLFVITRLYFCNGIYFSFVCLKRMLKIALKEGFLIQ
jgi:predicted ester cyclase